MSAESIGALSGEARIELDRAHADASEEESDRSELARYAWVIAARTSSVR